MNKLFRENRLINLEAAKGQEKTEAPKDKVTVPEKETRFSAEASRSNFEASIAARDALPSQDDNQNNAYRDRLNHILPLKGEQEVQILKGLDESLNPNSKIRAALKIPLELFESRLSLDATRNLRIGAPGTISGSFDLGPIFGSLDFESTPQTGENMYFSKSLSIFDKPVGLGNFGIKGSVMFDAATKDLTLNGTIVFDQGNTSVSATYYKSALGKSDDMVEAVVEKGGCTVRFTLTPATSEIIATVGISGTFDL